MSPMIPHEPEPLPSKPAERSGALKLYELINPSDDYTFRAPSLEVAGACAVLLSSGFGARCLDGDSEETTPILFGWNEWLQDRGMNKAWFDAHVQQIADAFDSFLIGGQNEREDVESMLALLDDDKRERWRADRQDRHRSSINQIGERAYDYAKNLRAVVR